MDYSFLGFVVASGLCLLLCWIAYRIFLEYKTSPKINRNIILGIFLLMLIIPVAVNIPMPQPVTTSLSYAENNIVMHAIVGEVSAYAKEVSQSISVNFLWIYLAGVVIMVGNSLKNLIQLCKIHRSSSPVIIDGTRVFVHERYDLAPFSWLNHIYVNKEIFEIEEKERRPLLLHELSHIKKHHYLDLILSQIVIIFQWFNPAAWKLRKEIKMLHEYEADQNVITLGVDEIEYQYLLVANLEKIKFGGMAHGLNGSSLKKRILMMHKKDISKGFQFRAMLILVAGLSAGWILHLPVVASSLKRPATALVMSQNSDHNPISFLQVDKESVSGNEEIIKTKKVYDTPDVLPVYGKDNESTAALMNDLSKIIDYPKNAEKNGIQGKVVVEFIVSKKGEMREFRIVKSADPELDQNAIEAIKALPRKWQPGTVGGKPVDCLYHVPINFRLENKG